MSWRNFKFGDNGFPCTANCEKRCLGCRSTCEAFKKYDAERIKRCTYEFGKQYDHDSDMVYTRAIPMSDGRRRAMDSRRSLTQKRRGGYKI